MKKEFKTNESTMVLQCAVTQSGRSGKDKRRNKYCWMD